jgi:hypothetical protein
VAVVDAGHDNLGLARRQANQLKVSIASGMGSQNLPLTFDGQIDLDIIGVSILHRLLSLVNLLDVDLNAGVLELDYGRHQRGFI